MKFKTLKLSQNNPHSGINKPPSGSNVENFTFSYILSILMTV